MPGDEPPYLVKARELHRRGVAALGAARPIAGARLLRAALKLLGWPDTLTRNGRVEPGSREAVAARALMSLAGAEVQLGHVDTGFGHLDRAAELVAPEDRGVLLQQRGLLLVLVGNVDEGLVFMDRAVPVLERWGRQEILLRLLLNRSMLHNMAGRVRLARADLDRCEPAARADGRHLDLAKVAHNRALGYLLEGDIPAALRSYEAAINGYKIHGPEWVAVARTELARALLAAGLAAEAAGQLDEAIPALREQRLSQEWAEAELFRAYAALTTGDPVLARALAGKAERRFRHRRNETWAEVAVLVRLHADFAQRRRLAAVAAAADELTERLRAHRQDVRADSAVLLSCRANLTAGRIAEARRGLARVRHSTSLENRLQRRLVLAELAAVAGRRTETFRHARAGLAMLAEHRSRFGSLDLQTSTTTLGAELADVGLAAALAAGSPARIFAWQERCRAQAFRVRQVRPTADADTVAAVAEWRQLDHVLRIAELNGRRDPQAQRRCAELEREIRTHGWQVNGTGQHSRPATLPELAAEVGRRGTVLLSYLVRAGELLVLAVDGRSVSLRSLGPWAAVAEPVLLLRGDLDTLCGRRLPAALEAVIRDSVRRQLDVLSDLLLAPLRPLLADRDVVIVPTRNLSALPWGMLADLRGRPVVVAPSASSWLHAARVDPPDWSAQEPLLVAGPHLQHAAKEVLAIACCYPRATVLIDGDATVQATLAALDGRGIVHIAAHGHHEPDNVLFSRLDLVDGPLMAYDIHQLKAAPAHVVLSSCDVGRATVRAGDELLGFTAALLYAGTRSVVSSAVRVADDVAINIMSAYHRHLASGLQPARALADAAATEPVFPFVCFGA